MDTTTGFLDPPWFNSASPTFSICPRSSTRPGQTCTSISRRLWHKGDLAMHERQQFSTFYLDGLLFGVQVSQVQEVIRYQHMTRVPLASHEVQGLINLRGQIVTALDLRRRLNIKERSSDRLPMNVVVRSGEEAVSLLVDEIGDVLEVDNDALERPPETLQGE